MPASRYFVTPYSTPPSAPGAAPASRRYRYDLFAPASALPSAPHVLLLHGFPDAGSLRGIAAALAFAGFPAVLPDMLGYGRSSKPPQTRIAEYGPHAMVNDLLALMESLVGPARFVVVGHDWGSFLAWRFALHAPQRVLGVAGISVPYVPQPSQTQFIPFERLLQVVPSFGYQAFFAEPRSSALIEPRIDDFLSMIFAAPRAMRTDAARTYEWNRAGTLENMLKQPLAPETLADFKQAALLRGDDWERVLDCFDPKRGGSIDAPLNWYRNRRIAWEEERSLSSLKLPKLPYLLLMSTHDAALPAAMGAAMPKHVPAGTLRTATAQGCGHWPHLEQPNWVVQQIRSWLEEEVGVGRAGKM